MGISLCSCCINVMDIDILGSNVEMWAFLCAVVV